MFFFSSLEILRLEHTVKHSKRDDSESTVTRRKKYKMIDEYDKMYQYEFHRFDIYVLFDLSMIKVFK